MHCENNFIFAKMRVKSWTHYESMTDPSHWEFSCTYDLHDREHVIIQYLINPLIIDFNYT